MAKGTYGKIDKDHPRYEQWQGWVNKVNEEIQTGTKGAGLSGNDFYEAIFFTAFNAGASLAFELAGEKEFADRLHHAAAKSLVNQIAKEHGKTPEQVLADVKMIRKIDGIIETLDGVLAKANEEKSAGAEKPLFDRGA